MRGELLDVLPAVAVLGRLLPTPRRVDGRAEAVHLRARVVVVVLPLDVVAREREQARDAVPVGGVARRRDRDRPGRVRRDHLDLKALAWVGPAGPVVATGFEQLRQRVAVPGGRDPDVHEAGAGDLGPLDVRARRDRLRDLLREVPRGLAALRRHPERDVRRVVAVRRVGRALQLDRRSGCFLELGGELRDGIGCGHRAVS